MNDVVSNFVSDVCSPKKLEKDFVEAEYEFLKMALEGRVFQSGSYARYTAISPLNDLDVFWVLSTEVTKAINAFQINVKDILSDLSQKLILEYRGAGKEVSITPQDHSVTIEFIDHEGDFSIDVIPAIEISQTNTAGDHLFKIPETGLMSKKRRTKFYKTMSPSYELVWILTDPFGYKKLAKETNDKTETFRKATKLLKRWKRSWKIKKNFQNIEFRLKSFHLELIVQKIIAEKPNINIIEVLDKVFTNPEKYFNKPQIKDLAQESGSHTRYIDSYLSDLTDYERKMISVAIGSAKIFTSSLKIESNSDTIIEYLYRLISGEEFISAYGYGKSSAINDSRIFSIDGQVRYKAGLLDGWIKQAIGLQRGLTRGAEYRQIDFRIRKQPDGIYDTYWKVRNTGEEARKANQLRGEITKGRTLNDPEKTSYLGNHSVTCYLVNPSLGKVVAFNAVNIKVQ